MTSYDMEQVLERINAMLAQEKKVVRCKDYFTSDVDEKCRKAMIGWCFNVVDAFDLSRESVGIAMNILDRYLSSGKGKSDAALQCRKKYQLATIVCCYMAVKLHEPAELSVRLMIKLCRNYYTEEDIYDMERDILSALEWRVYMSSTSPMQYVRMYLELLPEWNSISDVIIENAMIYNDKATSDFFFSTCKASSVGMSCLAGAINDTYVLSSMEKDNLWHKLSKHLSFDIASKEIRRVESQLLADSTTCEPKRLSRATLPRSSVQMARGEASSPISVSQL